MIEVSKKDRRKYEAILNNVALVVVKENTISKMFKRIKNIFGLSRNFERN